MSSRYHFKPVSSSCLAYLQNEFKQMDKKKKQEDNAGFRRYLENILRTTIAQLRELDEKEKEEEVHLTSTLNDSW
jgi:hypothetical protein